MTGNGWLNINMLVKCTAFVTSFSNPTPKSWAELSYYPGEEFWSEEHGGLGRIQKQMQCTYKC